MIGYYAIFVVVAVVVIIFAVLLLGTRGRGKLIECPECGAKFGRPAFAEKQLGIGITFSSLGDYTCPKCKYRASTSSFRYVGDETKSEGSNK